MEKVVGGATIWARQTIESEIFMWKPDMWFKIWFYIVNKVNHKDTKWFPRGENFFNYQIEKVHIGCSPDQWKKCIKWLKTAHMISTTKSTRGMIIKVHKYSFFQDFNNYKAPQKAQSKHNRSTTINKNVKNNKNILAKAKNMIKYTEDKGYEDNKQYDEDGLPIGSSKKKSSGDPKRLSAERLLKFYNAKYRQLVGDDIPYYPKSAYLRQVYPVIEKYPVDKLEELLLDYLKSDEKYIKESKWAIWTFLSWKVLNRLSK